MSANLGPEFYKKLVQITSDLGMKPEDLLAVMAIESGINPAAHNKNGNASGLIQFMPSTLKGLGFQGNHADFRNLSAENQLDYVKRLIQANMKINGGPFTSAAQYYVANFIPAALRIPGVRNNDPNTVIVAKNPTIAHIPGVEANKEKGFYSANSGLDANHDGEITFGDIQSVVNRATHGQNFQQALLDMKEATGYTVTPKKIVGVKSSFVYPSVKDSYDDLLHKHLSGEELSMKNIEEFENVAERYLHQVAASEKGHKKLYKKYLPNNHMTIQIYAGNYNNAVEFARILCTALDEELLATAHTHTDNYGVEVECSINGPEQECFKAITQLANSLSKSFKIATTKIGGISVQTNCIMNKKSSYQPISLRTAMVQYRKFLLKFI